MAINTYNTCLMVATGTGTTTYTKLVDIKDFPDFEAPEGLETTTLSDAWHTYIPGIKGGSILEFTANYDDTNYNTIKGYEGTEKQLGLYMGGTAGTEGKFTFSGYVSVGLVGGGVNEVVEMKVSVYPTSDITFAAGT